MNYAELIPDFGLSAEELDDKYSPDGDGEHFEFTRRDWREAVREEETLTGYWKWVKDRLAIVEDELDSDNPYNQPLEER